MADLRRHPLNVAGDFYVADGLCMACTAPENEAPTLLTHDSNDHCYFVAQPKTTTELQQAVMAVAVGCCGAVRYAGTDDAVIRRLGELGSAELCDHS